jgi:hypothetical protein
MIRFTIPRRLLSANQLLRMHWAKRRKEQRTWDVEVLAALLALPGGVGTTRPIRVVDEEGKLLRVRRDVKITRHGARLMDYDNLHGSVKMLVDALKHHGLIVDDSPQWCSLTVDQRKSKQYKVEVEIS